ncbi:MAG: hypothetical protein ABJA34_01250 [Pseudonocardiales bacterium]
MTHAIAVNNARHFARGRRAGLAAAVLAIASVLLAPLTPAHADTTVLLVTSTADTIGCTVTDCTLRGAILAANKTTGHVEIRFAISGGTSPFIISPTTLLPTLTNPAGIDINGYSQAGSAENIDPIKALPTLMINLRGQPAMEGIRVGSSNNTIRGLAIYNWRHSILINGQYSATGEVGNNRIVGDFICTDASGTFYAPVYNAGAGGILISNNAHDNVIGAPTPAERNVISGCAQRGLTVSFAGSSFNKVQNNIVGLSPDGSAKLSNLAHGLDVNYSATDNLIGGDGLYEHNVVSGNSNEGIEVSHGSGNRRNRVIGNYVGSDLTGRAAPAYAGNGQGTNIAAYGIRLEGEHDCNPCAPNAGFIEVADNVIVNNRGGGMLIDKGQQWNWIHDNLIGVLLDGTPAGNRAWGLRFEHIAQNNTVGPGNTIAYNTYGVQMQATASQPPNSTHYDTPWNRLTQNSIFSNGGSALGIDLAPYGKANAPGTSTIVDAFVNHGILAPVITSASTSAVSGTSCANCLIEVYLTDAALTSTLAGYGEPKTYLGTATADGSGAWSLSTALRSGVDYVTATATALSGNVAPAGVPSGATASGDTSEAARNKQVA